MNLGSGKILQEKFQRRNDELWISGVEQCFDLEGGSLPCSGYPD